MFASLKKWLLLNNEQKITALCKKATKHKREKAHDLACKCLKGAINTYIEMNDVPSPDLRCRYAKYLQAANRKDEGWSEINTAILENHNDALALNKIHDTARIFLQRESRYNDAIFHGLLSHLYLIMAQYEMYDASCMEGLSDIDLKSQYGQESYDEIKSLRKEILTEQLEKFADEEALECCVMSLVKKSDLENNKDAVLEILRKHTFKLPHLNLSALSSELKVLIVK